MAVSEETTSKPPAVVGLSDRMSQDWFSEFERGCTALGLEHRTIRIGADDWAEQLAGVDCFVWRLVMGDPSIMAEARSKIPLIEAMGIRCFPSAQMLWLYDDKIRETFFLRQHGYPTPRTWVFFDESEARHFVRVARYPLVAKSHTGAGAGGVELIATRATAEAMLDRIWRPETIWDKAAVKYYYQPRLRKGDVLLERRFRYRDCCPRYIYLQEFVETEYDWRLTTLGRDLISVFVRRNRPGDFRASGSGLWDKVDERELPGEACDLALRISNRHGFSCMTFDFMRGDRGWVIGELSYTFVLNDIYTTTLFRRQNGGYRWTEPIPIGVMHLRAVLGLDKTPITTKGACVT